MTIQSIKDAIARLPEDARAALAAWLNLQTMDAWDKEMQSDFSPGGRGHHLVEIVKVQISTGMFHPTSKGETDASSSETPCNIKICKTNPTSKPATSHQPRSSTLYWI